jgi:hypothetical protein
VLTDVNVGSTLHHVLLFIPLETSFVLALTLGALRRQSDARTSAECLSTKHPAFINSTKSLRERSELMMDALAVLRGKRTKKVTGSVLEAYS